MTKVEQGETAYIKLRVVNVGSNSNRVNLHFFLYDVCQRKGSQDRLRPSWLISSTVTAFVAVYRQSS